MNRRYTMCRRGAPRRCAFTLLEVLASLTLVGIVLPSVVGGLTLVLATAEQSRRQAEATGLAQAKVAELVAAGTTAGAVQTGDFGPDQPGYTWAAQWTQWEGTTLWQLDVKVTWTARGRERAVWLSTLHYTGVGQ
jgi:prepilin-type N-terminal cleavage/methylation domain-containing protein